MEQNVQNWYRATKNIFNAILLFSVGAVVASIMSGAATLWNTANLAHGGSGGINFFSILTWIVGIAVIAGYVLYVIGLGNLKKIVGEKESTAFGRIRIAAILALITAVLALFNVPAWFNGIINFIAYVIMLVGFNTLKKSANMPKRAKNGFSQLFIAMLINIIATVILVVFSWIPLIGTVMVIIASIIGTISFVMVITGWAAVRNSSAPID